jgi:hypothetical protein
MINFEKLKDIGGLLKLSIFTSVLYYCGYLSSEYHSKILGIQTALSALDYLKWGADFFIYSIIDFISNFKGVIYFSWIDLLFYFGLGLVLSRYWYKNKKGRKNKYIDLAGAMYAALLLAASIYYLRVFINNNFNQGLINYRVFENFRFIPKKYWVFIASVMLIQLFIWKSETSTIKKITVLLSFASLLLLPALYGVYGKGYEYPYIKSSEKLVIGENEKYFYTISIIGNSEGKREFSLIPKDSLDFKYTDTYNFFEYINSTIK